MEVMLVARLINTLRLPPPERSAQRVFAITTWLGLVLCFISSVLALTSGLTVLAALNAVNVVVSAVVLRWLGAHPKAMVRLFLWTFAFTLPLGALATTPMEVTMVGYFFLLPLVSATMLSERETRRWFYRLMVVGSVVLIAGNLGFTVPQVDPLPLFNQIFNFVATLVAAMALLAALSRERDRSEERMREVERAKSAFFANIGHEIRTPMNGVMGMTDALLMRELGGEEREMAQTIRTSGALMLALIDDLLDLSKLEAGRLALHEGPLSLTVLAGELRGLWTPMANKKHLEFSVSLEAALPAVVRVDGLRLRQVLGNLINNALKFTQRGSVRVELARRGEQLCCVVHDTGIGISPEQQQRLFERFVQADDARARRYQGSGLGLALSRDLATHMGGSLVVDSVLGQGSRFTCLLPLVEAEVLVAEPTKALRQLPAGLRVLVVDDNAINRLVAQRLLDHSGCAVEVAVDGRAAIETLGRHEFDVVLMDVHMPELDGLQVTRRIRESNQRLRIIGVSASAESDDVKSCRDAGMNDFLAKPMTRERLLETLMRHVPAA
jgi:signal transduction histidine kinase/CheY-like chemotaxis protein